MFINTKTDLRVIEIAKYTNHILVYVRFTKYRSVGSVCIIYVYYIHNIIDYSYYVCIINDNIKYNIYFLTLAVLQLRKRINFITHIVLFQGYTIQFIVVNSNSVAKTSYVRFIRQITIRIPVQIFTWD